MEERLPEREQNPACLKEGTMVGPWRVLEPRGHGVNGTVYRVEREGNEKAGTYALKLAHHSMDERFEREAELLSLTRHPNVPRFHSRGYYECALGIFPYVVMELVEGVALYDWARHRNPTQRQGVEVLAQVARALEALHGVGGVHRDVKGDNVVVRVADGRPYLADLGSGMVEGWKVLTADVLPPGTPAYRAPEAWSFGRMYLWYPEVHYEAGPGDDLFALGVMAYRLVTDEYPPPTHPLEPGSEVWNPNGGKGARPARELNPRVSAELDAIILKLLSVRRSQRFDGSCAEAAKALEQLLRNGGPELDQPLFDWTPKPTSAQPGDEEVEGEKVEHHPRQRAPDMVRRFQERDAAARAEEERRQAEEQRLEAARMKKVRAASLAKGIFLGAVVVGLVVVWILTPRQAPSPQWETPLVVQVQPDSQLEGADAGTTGLGDGISAASVTKETPPHQSPGFAKSVPETPLPGQRRAPCRARFEEVEIHGGCWYSVRSKPPCDEGSYQWAGNCYLPVMGFQRTPTSDDP